MKNQWLTPKGITAIIVMVIVVSGAIVGAARYITLPEDVEAVEQDVEALNKIVDYYYRRDQEQQQYRQESPPYPPPPRRCWDEDYQEYYNCVTGKTL